MYWPFEAATSATIENPKLSSPSSASRYTPGPLLGSPPAPPCCITGSQAPTDVMLGSQPFVAHDSEHSATVVVRSRAAFQAEPDTLRCWTTTRAVASASAERAG